MIRTAAISPSVTGVRGRMQDKVAKKRVLLVDDDDLPRRALAEQLEGLGYIVLETETALGARELVDVSDLLIVADSAAPADLGELCRHWREGHAAAPMVLAAPESPRGALEAEGNLVLIRPVRLAELARRLLEVAPRADASTLAVGALRLHPATRELADATGRAVRLTEREAALLAYLSRNEDRPVPRDELLTEVLGYAGETATHTLETHIYRLRRKLAEASVAAPRLVSEGGGYRLVAPERDPAINMR